MLKQKNRSDRIDYSETEQKAAEFTLGISQARRDNSSDNKRLRKDLYKDVSQLEAIRALAEHYGACSAGNSVLGLGALGTYVASRSNLLDGNNMGLGTRTLGGRLTGGLIGLGAGLGFGGYRYSLNKQLREKAKIAIAKLLNSPKYKDRGFDVAIDDTQADIVSSIVPAAALGVSGWNLG